MRPAAGCLAVLCIAGRTLVGQTDASVAAGAGSVRYPGGSSFSSASLAPAASVSEGPANASGWGSAASLSDGLWAFEGRGDLIVTSEPLLPGFRAAVEGTGAASDLSDGLWSTAAYGIAEGQISIGGWGIGFGLGPSAGWSSDTTPTLGLHLRARGWRTVGHTTLAFAVEPTRLEGAWFTDVEASASVGRGRVTASVWGAGRVSRTYGSLAAAGAWVQVFLAPHVSLEFGGGSYLPDLFLNLPRAGFVAAGARIHLRPRVFPQETSTLPDAGGRPGETLLRFKLPEAHTVAIAGDWNGWHVTPLDRAPDGAWTGAIPLASGVYHFSLVVDGVWTLPPGVGRVSDGFGGMVGVLDVP